MFLTQASHKVVIKLAAVAVSFDILTGVGKSIPKKAHSLSSRLEVSISYHAGHPRGPPKCSQDGAVGALQDKRCQSKLEAIVFYYPVLEEIGYLFFPGTW